MTTDSQLDAVRHRICKAEDEIVEVKQKLAAAEHAHNAEREQSLFNLLLSLNNQLLSLQEQKNILLQNQAPSKFLPSACTYWLTCIHIICAPFIE